MLLLAAQLLGLPPHVRLPRYRPLLPLAVVGVQALLPSHHLVVPVPQDLAHHLLRTPQGGMEAPQPTVLLLSQEAAAVALHQAMLRPGSRTTDLPASAKAYGSWRITGAPKD